MNVDGIMEEPCVALIRMAIILQCHDMLIDVEVEGLVADQL